MFFTILWVVLLGLPLSVYLALPLWSRQIQTRVVDVAESRLRVLILEREQNYSALLDLDEDYETGKLSQEDYQTLRRQLFEEIAAVIAEIETAEGTSLKEEIENYKKRKQET